MRETLRWEPPLYHPKDRMADVSGVGRYYISKLRRRKIYIVKLNAVEIGRALEAETAVGIAERHAYQQLHKESVS